MEFKNEKKMWKYAEEENNAASLSGGFSFQDDEEDEEPQLMSARTSCVSAASFRLWPSDGNETPWTQSPARNNNNSNNNISSASASSRSQPPLYDCFASLHRSEGHIFSLAITRDFIFTGSSSNRIHAWKQPDCSESGYIKTASGDIRAIWASGVLLFTAHGDCRVRVWQISPPENFRPKKAATLPKRRSLFSMYPKKNSAHQHRDSISCLAYSSKDDLLFTGSWDQTVKVWKVSERRCVDSFVAHEGHVNAIAINQEDGCVFTCSSDGTVKVWRRVLREGSHILTMTLKFQPSPINTLALSVSPGACFLYSGSSDGLVNFWEKERVSGRYGHGGFLQGHHFAVLCLATVSDLILSGSEDATIRIWRREEGNSFHSSLAVIDGHHGPVKCLAVALENSECSKGLLVYSASLDRTLKVWRVRVYPETMSQTKEKDQQLETREAVKMSPVLSPSWVEKKIQASGF